MNTQVDASEPTLANGKFVLDLEPDIVVLGAYLAQQRGLSLDDFLEYLITKEAAKGKYPGL